LKDRPHFFRIITKTPAISGITDSRLRQYVTDSFHRSLRRLGQKRVYGLLVHNADDLLQPGGKALFDAIAELRGQGFVDRVGASVYTSSQIAALLDRHALDLVQVPINILDQRLLVDGTLRRLKAAGIEIHARSIFLQGLLLLDMNSLPTYFMPYRHHLERFHALVRQCGVSALELAISFISNVDEIDTAIVGVARAEELQDIVAAARRALPIDAESIAVDDEDLLNPAKWVLH
jgi:aryl-alcohol dehydrogenase-like predicted oxidoreductase